MHDHRLGTHQHARSIFGVRAIARTTRHQKRHHFLMVRVSTPIFDAFAAIIHDSQRILSLSGGDSVYSVLGFLEPPGVLEPCRI